jgi:hypothetical protein
MKAGGGDMLTIFWCLINGVERAEADGCMYYVSMYTFTGNFNSNFLLLLSGRSSAYKFNDTYNGLHWTFGRFTKQIFSLNLIFSRKCSQNNFFSKSAKLFWEHFRENIRFSENICFPKVFAKIGVSQEQMRAAA